MIPDGSPMQSLFLMTMALLLSLTSASFGQRPEIRVKVTPDASEIFVGQPILATVEVTNTGEKVFEIPRPDRAAFASLLEPDDPHLNFSDGVGIIGVMGEDPTVQLAPGKSVHTKISLSGRVPKNGSVTFRIGFKTKPGAQPAWSEPVSVRFKLDEPLHVTVETKLLDQAIDLSNPQRPGQAKAKLRVTNTGSAAVDIGISNVCCLHELQSLISDNTDFVIDSGVTSCMQNLCAPMPTNLDRGDTWTQEFRLSYFGENPQPKPVTFRVGVKSVGHVAAWGNSVTLQITGGTPAWTQHVRYQKQQREESQRTEFPDGVRKLYYENGALMEERTYKNNTLNGPLKRYTQDGHLSDEIPYVDNKMHGTERRYYPNGKPQGEIVFHNHQLVSSITWDEKGVVISHNRYMREVNGKWIQDNCAYPDDHNPNIPRGMQQVCQ